jgi:type IV pilus assembly protein PilC
MYPIVVLIVACLVFIALLMEVVPQFEQFFSDVEAKLPFITQLIISLSKHVESITITIGSFF